MNEVLSGSCFAFIDSHFSFVLGAVTPAVVVPQLLTLQAKGFGVKQGIPTLVMAASSFDDVIAISLFGVFLGIAFSKGWSKIFDTMTWILHIKLAFLV